MSTEVEQKVVEMKFDNGKFERNASETLSTLDKLKQKLNFTGASKGLENVGVAAKNVNMSGLSSAVETVHAKFSALEVMGVTALANITNSAVNAGKRIVSALTIDPIKTGFQEYETQINSTQTILANTESKGSTIDDVNKALDELNTYADQTIYNFTEMTRNIGTFTAAGVDLDTSVNAIKGIANLAAVSGSTSQQASTAMYQLSQALASGTVKLMDWNSVVNAGMGGQVFQDALKETARVHGVAIDSMIEEQGSFRETLSEGWLTSEILTDTLQKFTLTTEGLTEEQIEANREMLRAKGYTEDQIEEIFKLGNTATNAATKVKTFSQMWDVMKETAQSGWSQTWKILIGDFEEAKALLTPLANFFTGFIDKISKARNDVLEGALGTPLGKMFESLREKIDILQTPLETVRNAIDDLGNIVDDVILGKFGNGEDRVNALTEAGINYYRVQNKVNETLGNSFRYTDKQIEAQDKLLGITNDQSKATEKLSEYEAEYIEELATLTEAELKSLGYTEEQIKAIKELAKLSDKLGISIKDLVLNMDEIDGRWLLIDSLKNAGKGLIKVFQTLANAWKEIFPPKSTEERAEALFNLIAAFHRFSSKLILSDEAAANLQRTFKGLFALIDIVLTVIGGPAKAILKAVIQVLKEFDVDILKYTGDLGDAIVAVRDWIDEHNPLTKVIEKIVGLLPTAIKNIKAWFAAFKEVPAVKSLINAISGIRDAFSKLFSGEIGSSEFARSLGANLAKALKALPGIALQIGKDFIAGFQNGIDFSFSGVLKKIVNFCLNLVKGFAEALGVQSPSWKAYDTATDFFKGFINGAKDMLAPVIAVLKKIGEGIVKVFKSLWDYVTDESGNVEWGKIIAGGLVTALILLLKKIASAVSGIASAFDGVGDLLSGAGDVLVGAGKALKSFSKVLNSIAWDIKAKALLKMAAAVGILVAAIWVLTTIDDPAKLWNAVGIIVVLAGVIVGLAWAMNAMGSASVKLDKTGLNIDGMKSTILQIGIAMLLLAATVKIIGNMKPEEAKQGFYRLAEMTLGLIAFIAAVGVVSKYSGGNIDKVGSMIKKLAVAMLLMVVVVKLVDGLSAEEMLKGAAFAAGFAIFVIAITRVAKSAGNNVSKVGGMVIKLTIAMLLLVAFCKLVSKLSAKEMLKGAAFAAGFAAFVWALVKVTKIGKKQQLAKISGLVLSVSVSLMLLVGVCKLVGKLSTEEMIKGAAFVAAFVVLIAVLKKILTIGTEQQMAKVAGTILAMSVAIAILAAVSVILSLIDTAGLVKGIIAVGLLSAMMALMIKSLKGAQNVKSSIIAMSVAIAIMAGSIALLSMIDTQKLLGASASLAAVMAAFALMIKSLKGLKKIPIVPILTMIVVVGALATVIWLMNDLDPLNAIASAAALSVLMVVTAGVLKTISKMSIDGKNAFKGILSLTAMAVPLLAFSMVLRQMNGIETSTKTVITLVALMTAMSLLVWLLDTMSLNLGHSMVGILSLLAMALPLLAFVGVLLLMNGVTDATEKVKALTILATACTLLLIPLSILGAIMVGSGGMAALAVGAGIAALIAMALPLLAFVGVLAVMQGVKNATANTLLLTGLMTTMGDLLLKLAVVGPLALIGVAAMAGLTLLMGAIGIMAVAVSVLMEACPKLEEFLDKGLPILEKLAGSIGVMIGKFIGGIGEGIGDSLVKIGEDIVAFMDKLAKASDNASKIDGSAFDGVEKLMGVMLKIGGTSVGTGVMDVFSKIFNGGDDSMDAFVNNAKKFFEGMKEVGEASSEVKIDNKAFDSVIEASKKLVDLQSSLEPIGGMITWFKGRDDLGTFGKNVAKFVESMKTSFSSLEGTNFNAESMNTLIDASVSLAGLQSELESIGGVVSWFKGKDDLATFGYSVADFIFSMKLAFAQLNDGMTFNKEAMNAIISAATDLSKLQSNLESIGGVVTWFSGRDDLGTFGWNVASFIFSMKLAFAQLTDVKFNTEAMNAIISAATSLAELQSHLESIGGVISWFKGRDDLGKFGTNAGQFISSMKTAMSSLDGVTFNEEAMTSVITAATKLADLQSKLEPMGGVVSWFSGRTDLGTFGTNIGLFADAMGKLKTGMGEDGISETVIASVTNAGEAIIALQKALPEEHWFDGKMNLSEFSDYISDFATAMGSFSEKASTINQNAVTTTIGTAYLIKQLINSLVNLDTSGLKVFTGIGTGGFGADGAAYKIAQTMSEYSKEVARINIDAVSTSVSAASKLKTLINSLVSLDTSGIEKFKVKSIGKAMKEYNSQVSGIDTGKITGSVSIANKLKNLISSFVTMDISGVSKFNATNVGSIGNALWSYYISIIGIDAGAIYNSIIIAGKVKDFITSLANFGGSAVGAFKSAVDELSKVGVSDLVDTFAGAATELNTAGAKMIDGLIKGMLSKTPTVSAVVSTLLVKIKQAPTAIRTAYGSFYSAGSYLVTGFCNGISQNSYKAAAKARAMASAAMAAAKSALGIHSPSKEFYKIGDFAGVAFVNALESYESKSYDAASSMAEYARNGISSAIQTINNMMDGDMDMQPTITPVIDLTDVETGIGSISKLLDMNSSIGLAANVNAVNSAMIRRNQNGANDDVVAAIGQLRKVLSDNTGTTYNIDGITYDDGSAVANAIETITRAALIGRRV